MTNPLGRFEFRVWGNQLGPFRDRLAAIAAPSEARENAETYILSRTTDAANVKIRAGLLEIKLMFEQVGRLERWRPALKSEFPLDSRTIVEQVFPHLAVAISHIARPSYTHVEFIRDLVRPHPDLAIVDVVKMRWRFTSEKYTAEFAEVGIAGDATSETVAIESEDPAAVLRAIAKLGLNSHANINYVRHLKLMTGMTPRAGASAN
jgi:exopolyphosphatase / guanosine-5'-triphosphate,3'-diphosphate pyrophosphatase